MVYMQLYHENDPTQGPEFAILQIKVYTNLIVTCEVQLGCYSTPEEKKKKINEREV